MKYKATLEFLSIKATHWENSSYYNGIIPPPQGALYLKAQIRG